MVWKISTFAILGSSKFSAGGFAKINLLIPSPAFKKGLDFGKPQAAFRGPYRCPASQFGNKTVPSPRSSNLIPPLPRYFTWLWTPYFQPQTLGVPSRSKDGMHGLPRAQTFSSTRTFSSLSNLSASVGYNFSSRRLDSFPETIPSSTSIPSWAYQNVTVTDQFDPSVALNNKGEPPR